MNVQRLSLLANLSLVLWLGCSTGRELEPDVSATHAELKAELAATDAGTPPPPPPPSPPLTPEEIAAREKAALESIDKLDKESRKQYQRAEAAALRDAIKTMKSLESSAESVRRNARSKDEENQLDSELSGMRTRRAKAEDKLAKIDAEGP